MNIYLILVPKEGVAPSLAWSLLDRIVKEYSEHLPEGFDEKPEKGKFDCWKDVYYLCYKRKSIPSAGVGKDSKGARYIITSGNIPSGRVSKNIKPRQGRLELADKPGGVYSVVAVDKHFGKISAWSSQPAAEAIYYAESDIFVSISSRPLLCALSLSKKNDIILSEDYVREYLALGYSACGSSPFLGVRTNNVEDMLTVVDGEIYFSSLPESPRHDFYGMEESEINETVSDVLLKSFDTLQGLPGETVFHLSGGKDSRTLLSAFSHLNLQPHAITYGRPSGDEPRIANSLAEISNIRHTVLLRDIVDEDFEVSTNEALRKCEGLMPSAPAQVVYDKDDAVCGEVNQPRVLGQHELQRGGWAKLMQNKPSHISGVLGKQVSKFVTNEASSPYYRRIRQIKSKRDYNTHVESLYWYCFDFRSSCYLTSSLFDFSRRNVPVFPMLDERFADACSAVAEKNIAMLVSESMVFKVIENLEGELLKIPLYGDAWRFEAKKENPNLSGEYYSYRATLIEQHPYIPKKAMCGWIPGSCGSGVNAFSRLSTAKIVNKIQDFMERSNVFNNLVRPDVLEVVRKMHEGSREEFLSVLDEKRRVRDEDIDFRKFLWRMYCVAVWSDGKWLYS